MATFRKKRSRQYKRRNTRRNRRGKKSLVGGVDVRRFFGLGPSKPPTSEPLHTSEPVSPHMIVQDVQDVEDVKDVGQAPLVTTTTKTRDITSVNSRIITLTGDIYKALEHIQIDNNTRNNDNKLHLLMMIKRNLETLEGIKINLLKSYDKSNHHEVYKPFELYQDAIFNIISINTEQERLAHIKKLSDTLSRIDFR